MSAIIWTDFSCAMKDCVRTFPLSMIVPTTRFQAFLSIVTTRETVLTWKACSTAKMEFVIKYEISKPFHNRKSCHLNLRLNGLGSVKEGVNCCQLVMTKMWSSSPETVCCLPNVRQPQILSLEQISGKVDDTGKMFL